MSCESTTNQIQPLKVEVKKTALLFENSYEFFNMDSLKLHGSYFYFIYYEESLASKYELLRGKGGLVFFHFVFHSVLFYSQVYCSTSAKIEKTAYIAFYNIVILKT